MSFAIINLPETASFNSETGTFSWKPGYDTVSWMPDETASISCSLAITVTDSGGLSDSKTFSIKVNNVNRKPVMNSILSSSIEEGKKIQFTVSAQDPDGDNIIYSAENLPLGADFDAQTRTFSWTPGCQSEGNKIISFYATDNSSPQLSDSQDALIKVKNAPCHFKDTVHQSVVIMDIFGYATIGDDDDIDINDEIAIFDSDDNLCGIEIITTKGSFGIMHIYGDDPSTEDEKEGPVSGEQLTIKVYDISEDKVYDAGFNESDTIDSEIQYNLTFEPQGSSFINLKAILKQLIPLSKGWNLISFSVNKCFYVGNKPDAAMISGIEYQEVSGIDEILTSIDGQYSYVRGFDQTGAKSYNGSMWSDMKYMAAGYGYWIKVKPDADVDEDGLIYLELEGARVKGDKEIQLTEGWNLIGYLGTKVFYTSEDQPEVPFLEGSTFCQVAEVSCIFSSIEGKYSYVRGFDQTGAKSYNLSPWSDLKYVGTGYGYWIKIIPDENPSFIWDNGNCECLQ